MALIVLGFNLNGILKSCLPRCENFSYRCKLVTCIFRCTSASSVIESHAARNFLKAISGHGLISHQIKLTDQETFVIHCLQHPSGSDRELWHLLYLSTLNVLQNRVFIKSWKAERGLSTFLTEYLVGPGEVCMILAAVRRLDPMTGCLYQSYL